MTVTVVVVVVGVGVVIGVVGIVVVLGNEGCWRAVPKPECLLSRRDHVMR